MLIGIGLVVIGVMLFLVVATRSLGKLGQLYLAEDYAGTRAYADRHLARFQLPAAKFALTYNAAGAAHHEGLFDECLDRLATLSPAPASLQHHLVESLRATTLLHLERDLPAARTSWAIARAIRKWKYDDAISALLLLRAGDAAAAKECFHTETTLGEGKTIVRGGTARVLIDAKRTRAIESYWRGLYLHEAGDQAGAAGHFERAATSGMRSIYATRARDALAKLRPMTN